MTKALKIFGINGPLVSIKGQTDLKMGEMVYVGGEKAGGRSDPADQRNGYHPGF